MSDFLLEPGAIEPEHPERHRSVRLVSTGVAPTAEIPRGTKPAPPPCYVPCEGCGASVLTGTTDAGTRLALDTSVPTYLVDWAHGAKAPRLVASRGSPVHRCHPHEGAKLMEPDGTHPRRLVAPAAPAPAPGGGVARLAHAVGRPQPCRHITTLGAARPADRPQGGTW